ncbi:MAG: hypothetical protein H3C35_04710 [Bacteroidetes bacterium]|nr:hypothetical protein [Bacteroidota bacterium]
MKKTNLSENLDLDDIPSQPVDESYALIGYAQTMAEMDLLVKNLQLNNIDAIAFYFPAFHSRPMKPTLYVKKEMLLRAKELLAKLDLNDFLQAV